MAALPQSPPAILTFLDGTYRLDDFPDANGHHSGIGLNGHSSGATADKYLWVRAAPGARPVIVGSHRITGKVWTEYPTSPRIFRTPVDALENDVDGLWRVVDGAANHFDQADRYTHVMQMLSGTRSHADVSALDADPMLNASKDYLPEAGSPVLGAGDGSSYGKTTVNIGPYPFYQP